MAMTWNGRLLGTGRKGVNWSWGRMIRTRSPGPTPRLDARSFPRATPVRPSGVGVESAFRLPATTCLAMLVTFFSSSSRIPFRTTPVPPGLRSLTMSPFSRTTGEAARIPGTPRRMPMTLSGSSMGLPAHPPKIVRWAFAPRIFSRMSCWKPVIRARAMMRAATPTMTPRIEMREMTETKVCLRFAVRYRRAM